MTNPYAGDARRALVLITHRARADGAGMQVIVDEVVEAGSGTRFLQALLTAYEEIAPQLRTDDAVEAIGQLVDMITAQDPNPDWCRAARLIAAHDALDTDRFNQVTAEANQDGRTGALIGAIVDVWAFLLPELCSPLVLGWLKEMTDRAMGEE